MELAEPFTTEGPKVLNEAGLANFHLMRQEGSPPFPNENAEQVFFRVNTWFKTWLPYWCETPDVNVVILPNPKIFSVLHKVIDGQSPGVLDLKRGVYGSIVAYNCDGWVLETIRQLQ